MNKEKIIKSYEQNRYTVQWFDKIEDATEYLAAQIKGKSVGFGDSQTMMKMQLHEILEKENMVYDPLPTKDNDEFLAVAKQCLTSDIFLTSVNAATEEGILLNMDGTGNRIAGSLFGHEKVYFILGTNKLASNLDEAIWRVRNIAAPLNAKRLNLKTPCAIHGDKCYNCSSSDRICNGLIIHYKKMNDIEMEVIFIDDDLGY